MPHFTEDDTKALRDEELAQGHASDGAGITDADSPPPEMVSLTTALVSGLRTWESSLTHPNP